MANIQAVGFTDPYSEQALEIERKRKLAEALQLQGGQPLGPTETVGGWAIRKSPMEGVGKLAQSLSGAYQENQANQEAKALSQKYRDDLTTTLTQAGQAATGTPAIPAPADDLGGGPGRPAQAPNRQALIQALMGHPATQPLAMAQLSQDLSQQQLAGTLASAGYGPAATVAPGTAPAAGAAPTGGRGIPPGVDPLAWALMVQKGDTAGLAKLVQDAANEQNKPQIDRGFGIKKWNPATGKYELVSNPEDITTVKRAELAATQPYEPPVTLKTSSGQEVQLSRPEYVDFQKTGQLPPRLGGKVTGTAPTEAEAMAKVKEAIRQGGQATIAVDKPAGLGTVGVSESQADRTAQEADKAYQVDRAKGYVKMAEDMRHTWTNSQSQKQMLDRLQGLFADPNITKGALGESISDLKNIAASLGVNIKGLPAEQAIQSVTNEFALQLRNPAGGAGMPGAMSDQDRKFLASIPPGLSKTPEGRAQIMETMRKKLQRDQEIADMAIKYEQEHGKLDNGFEKQMREFANANPIFAPAGSVVSPDTQKLLDKYAPKQK